MQQPYYHGNHTKLQDQHQKQLIQLKHDAPKQQLAQAYRDSRELKCNQSESSKLPSTKQDPNCQ